MSKATDDMMDTLHLLTAEKLADIIRNGVEVVSPSGEVNRVSAPAAYIAAAIKFLKDNNVTAEAKSTRMASLGDVMEDLPDLDDYPTYQN